ncbi:hypothetical protein GYA49_02710 [Candidatus Beckwithbacteria bacterium]|nr:hypothetical protein [Candidatus Beckwithbacteria bacterium]
MLLTPHIFLGLFFIAKFRPEVAVSAALVSHFLFDYFLPHWNPHLFTEMKKNGALSQKTKLIIAADVLVSVISVLVFMSLALPNLTQAFYIGLTALFAVLPDLIEAPFYLLKLNGIFRKFVEFEHKNQATAGPLWGNVSQALVIIVCLLGMLS